MSSKTKVATVAGSVRHGHVFSPASRANFAWEEGLIDEGALNQREAGKFFPHREAGLTDPFAADDVKNSTPPADGKIASAGQLTGAFLDNPGSHWRKHEVTSRETLSVSWGFSAVHKARRWNYFITKADWNPDQVLTRDQFEPTPFYMVEVQIQPYWGRDDMIPANPTTHQVPLPNREGYHVMLAVWEVADTSMGFYQVVDLDFIARDDSGERPDSPTGLAAREVGSSEVVLQWDAPHSAAALKAYRIIRNGTMTVEVSGSVLGYTDSVEPATTSLHHQCHR